MPVKWKFVVKVDELMGAPKRTFNGIVRKALLKAVKYWHKKYLPHHFTQAAYHRYAGVPGHPEIYRKRKALTWRDPKTGQQRTLDPAPLVDTGRTRAMALGTPRWQEWKWSGFSATKARASVRFEVPMHVLGIRQWGYRPLEEMSVINRQELSYLAKVVANEVARLWNSHRSPVRRRSSSSVPTGLAGM